MAMETEFSAEAHHLFDPPVIRGARPSAHVADDGVPASHPFLDLLDAAFNALSAAELKATLKPQRALTENCSTAGKEVVEDRDTNGAGRQQRSTTCPRSIPLLF